MISETLIQLPADAELVVSPAQGRDPEGPAWWATPEYGSLVQRSLAAAPALQTSTRNVLRAFANDPAASAEVLKLCGQKVRKMLMLCVRGI